MAPEKRKDGPGGASLAPTKKMKKPDLADPHEVVTIVVGSKEKESFIVYKDFLIYHSPYFDKALNGPWTEATNRTVTLPHTTPEAFGLFVSWIYTGKFREEHCYEETGPDWAKRRDLDKPSAEALIRLWLLADYFMVPKLQNMLITKLWEKLARINHCFSEHFPLVYKNTDDDSPLRKLFVDYCCYNNNTRTSYINKRFDHVPREFLFDVWAAHNEMARGKVKWEGFKAENYFVEDATDKAEDKIRLELSLRFGLRLGLTDLNKPTSASKPEPEGPKL